MSKARLGFDIGNSSIKIAVAQNADIQLYEVRMPDNMMQDGEIVIPNAFSDFLKRSGKSLGLPKGECALALPARQAICRAVTLPKMSVDQLMLNLPYEFSEFIQGNPDRFICDYAMCEDDPALAGDEGEHMTMMAAAASKERITQYIRIFAEGGFRLKRLLPEEMALIRLVQEYRSHTADAPQEYCFVNLGQDNVGITVVKNDRIQATRQIEGGCKLLDLAIADLTHTDPFVAGTYKITNYQNVLDEPGCQEIYQSIAVEILKVVNFYRFNYRDSELEGIYLTGGGSAIPQFCQRIEETLGLSLFPVDALVPGQTLDPVMAAKGVLALGMVIG